MNEPKVSILLPVYNADKYLNKAINSILAQSYTNWELIIVNDGSIDNSEKIIEHYKDARIVYKRNTKNLGLIRTLNLGIEYCRGKYIARMDADDICMPERIQKQVSFLNQHPQYIMCGTNALVIDADENRIGKIRNFSNDELLRIHLLFSVPFIHPSMMIRREAFDTCRFDKKYIHAEDYELWTRLSDHGKIANLNEDLLLYRWHDANISVVNSVSQDTLKDDIIIELLQEKLDITPSQFELFCHKITFQQYRVGTKAGVSLELYNEVEEWFSKLIGCNGRKKEYNPTSLVAFLWSRWIVLCLSQKKYKRMFIPRFASFHPSVMYRLIVILLFLRKK